MRIHNGTATRFWRENRLLLCIMALLLIERLIALATLGAQYTLASDDLSYVKSGIYFAQHGTVTMHGTTPSAQIMPGMTWLIGIFVLVLGQGYGLWLALKLFWIGMGTATAYFLYKSVTLFAPKWYGIVACLPLFGVDFVWTDNLILTESPFILCLSAMLYYTFLLGRDRSRHAFVGCAVSYIAALLLKANIAIYPLFALVYLLAVKYPFQKLLRRGLILACLVLCFLVPWTVRNYMQFHALIPLTYGAGNPTLLGTYQGYGYPADEDLDYVTNVDEPFREQYAAYYDDNGNVPEKYQKYLCLQHDGETAAYRIRVWAEQNPKSLLVSYGIIKPLMIVNGTFYWERVFNVPGTWVQLMQDLNLLLCAISIISSLLFRKHRAQCLYLMFLYGGNVFIYAMTFAFGRYSIGLMPMRCVLIGLGAAALAGSIRKYHASY